MHRQAIIQTGRELGVTVRPLEYAHWDDPIIFDALHGFDGIFFYVSTGQMPKTLIRQMSEAPCKLAVFDKDLSEQGIVSIQLCQDRDFFNLYESLRTNGYTQFDCVNCQSHDEEIDRRISSWGCWRDKHGLPGDLHDLPTAPWQDSVPNGYRVFSQLLAGDVNPDTAYICTTYAAVQGALRVAYERNLKPGVDFGLACYQSMTNPRYLCPTITSLEMPMIHHICLKIFNWFLHQGDSNWAGSLRLYPDDRMVFQGESTAHQACVTTT
jgi:DNA-binding LacI/PurR family transcriptional regulator